ncbi:histidine--tRNA ligase [Candidatus Peregrinibacteria bacterium]|nr:histidine--tRNA ligase [Candidatus Peregrinibacteria bacterium]
MTNSNLITPEILRGTRDFLPEEMAKREYVLKKIVDVFRSFGYDTIETPVIEYLSTLTGQYGEEGSKLMYTFEDNGGRKIALRYDQTVPTARLVAANYKELPMPFKRYQISRVWRADRPAKGRYREFYQCDIDIIGTNSLLADAEVAKVIYSVLRTLGFQNFVIKWNSRRFINQILSNLEIPEKTQGDVIRIFDKLGKIGKNGVFEELSKILAKEKAEELLETMTLSGTFSEKLEKLKNYDTAEIREFHSLCENFGIPEENLEFDISLARGLDYYTGVIFEAILPDVEIGSVCGGGRYDDLCGRFMEEKLSGTGVSFGFDRLITAMEEKWLLQNIKLNSEVLVTYFDEGTLQYSQEIVNDLQNAQISSEIYFEAAKLGKQMKYADKKGIPFVIFCGSDEIKNDMVKIKMMKTGKEKIIPRTQLVQYFEGFSSETE